MCVLSILPLSTIKILDFGILPTVCFFFYFRTYKVSGDRLQSVDIDYVIQTDKRNMYILAKKQIISEFV